MRKKDHTTDGISKEVFEQKILFDRIDFKKYFLSKTLFRQIVADILEGDARERFRKWDNVKYVAEKVKDRRVPKKSYRNKNWGMEIKTNNRLDPEDGVGLRFGVVVTIKEMYGINRIDEFIKNCNLNGWLVNAIDIQNRIEIHEKINEEIRFD